MPQKLFFPLSAGGAEGALKDAVIDLCSDAMKHARLVLTQVSNQAAATAENLANRDVVMTDTDATVHLLKTVSVWVGALRCAVMYVLTTSSPPLLQTIIELLDALLDDTLEKEKIKNLSESCRCAFSSCAVCAFNTLTSLLPHAEDKLMTGN